VKLSSRSETKYGIVAEFQELLSMSFNMLVELRSAFSGSAVIKFDRIGKPYTDDSSDSDLRLLLACRHVS
jgi:hypothetical protein